MPTLTNFCTFVGLTQTLKPLEYVDSSMKFNKDQPGNGWPRGDLFQNCGMGSGGGQWGKISKWLRTLQCTLVANKLGPHDSSKKSLFMQKHKVIKRRFMDVLDNV